MDNKRKAKKAYAKYMAFSTAAEMIRQHIELGFRFEDEELTDEYKKAIELASKKIETLATPYLKKYIKFGIDINADADGYSCDREIVG